MYGDYVPKRKSPTASDPTTAMTSADTPSTSSTTPTLMTSPVTPIQVVNRTIKLAIFDVDKTMICPRDKGRFPKDADDWEWFDKLVPAAIRAAYADGSVYLHSKFRLPLFNCRLTRQIHYCSHLESRLKRRHVQELLRTSEFESFRRENAPRRERARRSSHASRCI